jgi:hypothetical protein
MPLRDSLEKVLAAPSAEDLWQLRADLLEQGAEPEGPLWEVLGEFREFLDCRTTLTSSRAYSELASKLDIGAISGVILEQLSEAAQGSALATRLVSGALSEGLMALATRQHVHAWDSELDGVYRRAAWFLHDELWRWTIRRTPDLAAGERRRLLSALLAPVLITDTPVTARSVLLLRLFQIVLLGRLVEAGIVPPSATTSVSDEIP